MRPINGKKTPMDGVVSLSRNAAAALVDREERRTGSRMVAYHNVARTVGTSAEWLRKFVSSNGPKEPGATVWFNLITLYRQVCNSVLEAGDREKRLKEECNAALESLGLLVEAKKRADRSTTQIGRDD